MQFFKQLSNLTYLELFTKFSFYVSSVIPQDKPIIKNLNDTYLVGDLLASTCLTDSGDPTPTISWYLNDELVSFAIILKPDESSKLYINYVLY